MLAMLCTLVSLPASLGSGDGHGLHLLPAEPAEDFPGETFRVLKDKEEKAYGEYRTRRLVLEAWERQRK